MYLIEGGAPAGTSGLPGVVDWRIKRKHMNSMTRKGNNKTRPRGTETAELPFRRILRLKKPVVGIVRSISLEDSFSVGRVCPVGNRFLRFCTISIDAVYA